MTPTDTTTSSDTAATVGSAPQRPQQHTQRRPGSSPALIPGHLAAPFDPDIPPWERQPKETDAAWAAFVAFRDSDERKVGHHGTGAKAWSAKWSWGYRAAEYDRYITRKDAEDLVRYRRKMNDRQRKIASAVQQRVAQWLQQLDPTKMSTMEAMRALEVAVKIERLAGGAESERLAVAAQGPVDDLSAEQVNEALAGLAAEINRIIATEPKEGVR